MGPHDAGVLEDLRQLLNVQQMVGGFQGPAETSVGRIFRSLPSQDPQDVLVAGVHLRRAFLQHMRKELRPVERVEREWHQRKFHGDGEEALLGELGACLVHRVQPWRDELDGLDCLPHLPQPPLGILAEDLLVAEVRFHVDGGRVEQLPRLGISGQRIQTQEPMKERRSRARHANHKERLAHFHRLDGRLGGQQGFHPQAARQAATELIPDAQVAQRRDPLLLERPQDQAEVLLELQTPKVAGSRLAHRPLLHVVVVQLVLKRAQAQLPRRPGQRVEHLSGQSRAGPNAVLPRSQAFQKEV
mmetsp:Transcript_12677/g.46834  ORF Transcript_12677/g.46834 Transcript_12677/m.46834 type:complete len:301 (+) Transcript_12677:539-1441(+)